MNNLPKSNGHKRCADNHPPLVIGDYKIYGGSCSNPVIDDADVYVGLDYSMKKSTKAYPWREGESFLFPIQDMHCPSDPVEFDNLINWLSVQLVAGKKVHVGCIGGHGRTGTVFAALVKVMTGEKDAITYVREHYCKKVVESDEQVDFLVKHYGIKKVEGHKSWGTSYPTYGHAPSKKKWEPTKAPAPFTSLGKGPTLSIWGDDVVFDNLL